MRGKIAVRVSGVPTNCNSRKLTLDVGETVTWAAMRVHETRRDRARQTGFGRHREHPMVRKPLERGANVAGELRKCGF